MTSSTSNETVEIKLSQMKTWLRFSQTKIQNSTQGSSQSMQAYKLLKKALKLNKFLIKSRFISKQRDIGHLKK